MKIGGLFFLGSHYSSSDFATSIICCAVIFKTSNMGESKLSQSFEDAVPFQWKFV